METTRSGLTPLLLGFCSKTSPSRSLAPQSHRRRFEGGQGVVDHCLVQPDFQGIPKLSPPMA
ncbi:MAG: hypothetical protein SLRJCFUN_000909, partial [Candidatus Fervidibacter sp.]